MVYRMIFNQTAYFGRGAIKEIPAVAKQRGFTKAFIVTDPVLLETGTAEKVTKVLDEAGLPYEVFSNVKPNPPVECIKDGVAKFAESGADFLIGLGGGSPQDTCKGIGIITANPEFADVLLSMQTIRMIAKNLAKSADGDIPAGEQMAYASYITGMAYSNVGLGLVHGMAHPLGGRLGVAHGVANGILLAPVMEYNKDFTGEKYRDIADAFGVEDAYTGDLEKVREEAVQAVHKLTVDLKNPTTISEVGATEADLEPLAHDAFNDVCTPGNPRQATEEDILAIYKSLM